MAPTAPPSDGVAHGRLPPLKAPSHRTAVKAREFILGNHDGRAQTPQLQRTQEIVYPFDSLNDSHEDHLRTLLLNGNKISPEERHQHLMARLERGLVVPHVLDGVRILTKARVHNPVDVYTLDVSNELLRFVVSEDLELFENVHTLRASENLIPFAKLAGLPNLRRLELPLNDISDLDLEVEGHFKTLEQLDLSYNSITPAAFIVLATLPSLKVLDLTQNKIRSIPIQIAPEPLSSDNFARMDPNWREAVIELLMPKHVAMLDAAMFGTPPGAKVVRANDGGVGETQKHTISEEIVEDSEMVALELVGGGVNVHISENAAVEVSSSMPCTNETAQPASTMPQIQESVTVDGPVWPLGETLEPAFIVGFNSLEYLTLERNSLHSEDSFKILGRLPSLKRLNISYNKFKSFVFLSHLQSDMENYVDGPPPPANLVKYDGFEKLSELRLSFNKIDTLEGLFGLVWLPALKFVWIEGNPILAGFSGKCDSEETLPRVHYASCNPIQAIPRIYGIRVQDLIYQPHRSTLDETYYALSPRKNGRAVLRRIIRPSARELPMEVVSPLCEIDPEEANPQTQKQLAHTVEDPPGMLIGVGDSERLMRRRDYKLTDAQVEETVRTGRVLTLKELRRLRRASAHNADVAAMREKSAVAEQLAKERERLQEILGEYPKDKSPENIAESIASAVDIQQGDTEMDNSEKHAKADVVPTNEMEDSNPGQHSSPALPEDLIFDPTVQDNTFITAVHITGGGVPVIESKDGGEDISRENPQITFNEGGTEPVGSFADIDTKGGHLFFADDVVQVSEDSDTFSSIQSDAPPPHILSQLRNRQVKLSNTYFPLPTSIQASIRALRHALSNPVSYWRIAETSYAKPTFAHIVRVKDAAVTRKAVRRQKGLEAIPEDGEDNVNYGEEAIVMQKSLQRYRRGLSAGSEAKSESSSVAEANMMPESGNISPANTMWTTVAVKFQAEQEAAIAAATRATKNFVTTARIGSLHLLPMNYLPIFPSEHTKQKHSKTQAGDAKAAKAVVTNLHVELPRIKGRFSEEDALKLAEELSKEQLRKRISVMNESEEEIAAAAADRATVAFQPGRDGQSVQQGFGVEEASSGSGIGPREATISVAGVNPINERLLVENKDPQCLSEADNQNRESSVRFSGTQKKLSASAAAMVAEKRVAAYKKKVLEDRKLAESRRTKAANKLHNKDEFEIMTDMMTQVDEKLSAIEGNLASILKSDILQKHIPQSRKLINDVQAEYKRIEKMYRDSALAAIEESAAAANAQH
ncbi:X-ray radiation resistance-associated protein 1 [Entophlyctis sp. JEL0112]|nr:X-ray radiation resistance-associated protein 1 [Entophlyctis sp. JEL0112]